MELKTAVLAFLCFIFTLSLWDSVLEEFYLGYVGENASFSDVGMGYVIASFIGLSIFLFLNKKFSQEEESSEY